jgi:hypothetical protein
MRKALMMLTFASITCSLACDDSDSAENQRKINNAADKTGDALQRGAEKTGEALNKAAKSTGEVVGKVADTVSRTKVKVDVDVATKPTTRPAAP